MNILFSSTRQWNPGDEFIFFGVRNLLEQIFSGEKINWVLYDRNPDLFADGFNKPVPKDKIWGNSFHHLNGKVFDYAVIAGTPEWMGLPLKNFYTVVKNFNIPLILLGTGYVDAPIRFTEDELYCFKKLLRVAGVRDNYASRAFNENGINHEIIPCPALFASLKETIPHEIKKIGFIIQTNRTPNQNINGDLSNACVKIVNQLRDDGFQVDTVCHYIDEFVEFAETLMPVRYSYDARDYLEILNDYDLVISTRLHGAILANSLGKPAILLNNDSRVTGAASYFPYISNSTPDTIFNDINNIDLNKNRNIASWKAQIWGKYNLILKNALPEVLHGNIR